MPFKHFVDSQTIRKMLLFLSKHWFIHRLSCPVQVNCSFMPGCQFRAVLNTCQPLSIQTCFEISSCFSYRKISCGRLYLKHRSGVEMFNDYLTDRFVLT